MARPKSDQPGYRYHISGQAVVTFDGKNFYLGEHNSPESRAKYHALLGEYLANGKQLPEDTETHQADAVVTVRVITAAFRRRMKARYGRDPKELNRLTNLCTSLDLEFGDTPADEFGPLKLEEFRDLLIAGGSCRTYINRLIRSTKKIFKFATSKQLIDKSVPAWLDTLEPLQRGESEAPESTPVVPVDLDVVRATAAKLSPVIRAMIQIQAGTGMRPSELCNMRPCDIEQRSDDVWIYKPSTHKTAHRGKAKTVPIVGEAMAALAPYLDRAPDAFCFSPAESMQWVLEQRRKNRKSKVQPSQKDRSKAEPKRKPGVQFKPASYYRAIREAAKKAGVSHWNPYQLRHTTGTAVRDALGVEAAQAILGHSHADMTQHYAKQTEAKAIEAAKVAPKI